VIHVRYFSGTDFDPAVRFATATAAGKFLHPEGYYQSHEPFDISGQTEIRLKEDNSSDFRKITEVEFFNKTIL
jgi:hypothetical protein